MKIDIYQKEIEALDLLLRDAKVSVPVGMLLGAFRTRIQMAVNKENEKQLKEKYSKK